jgi:hypothetical protein
MAVNIEQHHAFHAGFEAVGEYFQCVQNDPSKYDGEEVIKMIDSFAEVFLAHLNDEIKTLAPEIVQKIFPDPEEAKKIVRDMVKWMVSTSSSTIAVPWVSLQNFLVFIVGYDPP